MTPHTLWRNDGERFTSNDDGTFSMDSSLMSDPYRWTYDHLMQTGNFSTTKPNHMNDMLKDLRGTGRTTRMLQHARELANRCQKVCVLCENYRSLEKMHRAFGEPHPNVSFHTEQTCGNFSWSELRFRGMNPDTVVLIDHALIESRFGRILNQLHAYDE